MRLKNSMDGVFTMRARKVDANQSEIVLALRQMGCSVSVTSSLGHDFPDLVVGFRGKNYLLEIKDGNKPPSHRKLRPGQQKFFHEWKGQVALVNSVTEAIDLVNGMCKNNSV